MRGLEWVITSQGRLELLPIDLAPAPAPISGPAPSQAPPPGRILTRTLYTVISPGTELDIFSGRDPESFVPQAWQRYPFRPGYANVGEVVALGPATDSGLHPGDVVLTSAGHRSHALPTADQARRIPAGLPPEHAGLLRLAAISATALRQSHTIPGDRVAVFGLGLIGHLAAQLFALSGRRVVGVDPVPGRRELAERVGLTALPDDSGVSAALGGTPDCVVDAVGRSSIILRAAELVRKGGEVILLGTPRVPEPTENVTAFFRRVHSAGLRIIGAHGNSLPDRAPGRAASITRDIEDLCHWALDGRLRLAPLVTHQLPYDALPQAYDGLEHRKNDYMAVVLDWRHAAPG